MMNISNDIEFFGHTLEELQAIAKRIDEGEELKPSAQMAYDLGLHELAVYCKSPQGDRVI